MRKHLIVFGLWGLISPIIILIVTNLTDLGGSGWSAKIFGLFWFSYLSLMALHSQGNTWDLILFMTNVIGINVLYFLFLGWLFWLGKTKNKGFYALSICILLLVWNFIYLRIF